ncbi:MAG: PAS domain S-box protein [Anaerolineales bacterium]|nr:PAS domain S-box protein [Anaerolineales bacterium]
MKKRGTRKTSSPPRRSPRAASARTAAARRTSPPKTTSAAQPRRKTPGPAEAGTAPREKKLRVLIVEDLEDDAILMNRELERGGYTTFYERVDTPQALAEALESREWDLVLSDHSMPKFSAPQALALIKDLGLDLPFILVSGSIGEDQAVAIMKAGAGDYLRKENLARLLPVVEREIREAEIRKARLEAETALRESEALYRTLIETSPDAIVVTDLETRVRMTNPRALRLLGVNSFSELEGVRWVDSFAPLQSESVQRILDTLRRTERVDSAEVLLSPRGRPPFSAEVSGSMLGRSRGKPDTMLFVLRDISSRKSAEQQIRMQLERLAALRTIDAAITASVDLRVTLMVLLDELTSQLRVDTADVLLLNPHSQTLRCIADRGFRFSRPREQSLFINHGTAGRVALERRMILLPEWDIREEDPARTGALATEEFHSYIAAPLIARGQVKGVLEIFHRRRLDPDPGWISCLETMAEQAAIAIDNAMLFEDLQRSNIELTLAYDATIEGWSRALDLRDHATEGHAQRVTEATIRLARALGMPEAELIHARRGALLHDIGKMAIPDGILLKPGPLDDPEWETMRRHPVSAFEWLAPIAFLRPSLDIPYCHHERWDGNGYPRRLKGEQIPIAARIFAVVDNWDALRSNRPYRKAWPDAQVKTHLKSLAGTFFDASIVRTFLEIYYP